MTLAKHTGSRLHFSWVANAALMQREANLDAAKLMKARLSTSETTSDKLSSRPPASEIAAVMPDSEDLSLEVFGDLGNNGDGLGHTLS